MFKRWWRTIWNWIPNSVRLFKQIVLGRRAEQFTTWCTNGKTHRHIHTHRFNVVKQMRIRGIRVCHLGCQFARTQRWAINGVSSGWQCQNTQSILRAETFSNKPYFRDFFKHVYFKSNFQIDYSGSLPENVQKLNTRRKRHAHIQITMDHSTLSVHAHFFSITFSR